MSACTPQPKLFHSKYRYGLNRFSFFLLQFPGTPGGKRPLLPRCGALWEGPVPLGRNRGSRSREAAWRRNWYAAEPRKMRGKERRLTENRSKLDPGSTARRRPARTAYVSATKFVRAVYIARRRYKPKRGAHVRYFVWAAANQGKSFADSSLYCGAWDRNKKCQALGPKSLV